MPIALYDSTWQSLAREAGMAGRLLGSGLEALRRADSSVPALYYEAFFGITIGLERVCKLAIVLTDYLHRGIFPTDKEMRLKYGHDLSGLITEVEDRIAKGELSAKWPVPHGQETAEAIILLTEFARTTRYYNISTLSGGLSSSTVEPIVGWFDLVLRHNPQKAPTPSSLRNTHDVESFDNQFGHAFMVLELDEHGNRIQDLAGSAAHGVKTEHVQRAGTMICVRVARALASALDSLSYGKNANGDVVPDFGDFFGVLFNDDKYLRGRKTFNHPH